MRRPAGALGGPFVTPVSPPGPHPPQSPIGPLDGRTTPELVQIWRLSILIRSLPVIPAQKRAVAPTSYDNHAVCLMSSSATAPQPRPGCRRRRAVRVEGRAAHQVTNSPADPDRLRPSYHCEEPVKDSGLSAYFRVGCLCRARRPLRAVSHEVMKQPTASAHRGTVHAPSRPFARARGTTAPIRHGRHRFTPIVRFSGGVTPLPAGNLAPGQIWSERPPRMAFPARGRHHALS